MSTLQWNDVSVGQGFAGLPAGVSIGGSGGSCAIGSSRNTSKKLFGAIGGTSKCPIGP
jgi:F0F1-type ATP synthase membrane subunit c/vacuolar-type H+-ATPase subunit K